MEIKKDILYIKHKSVAECIFMHRESAGHMASSFMDRKGSTIGKTKSCLFPTLSRLGQQFQGTRVKWQAKAHFDTDCFLWYIDNQDATRFISLIPVLRLLPLLVSAVHDRRFWFLNAKNSLQHARTS